MLVKDYLIKNKKDLSVIQIETHDQDFMWVIEQVSGLDEWVCPKFLLNLEIESTKKGKYTGFIKIYNFRDQLNFDNENFYQNI